MNKRSDNIFEANILIIEDDPDIREGIRILLESVNYKVNDAEDGQQGLQKLDEQTDLVILDIMMPGMSGLRVCEEIRKDSNVPILFLTAKSQESDKMLGLIAGGDDYLTKPFSYAELLGRVKALTRRYNVYKGREAATDVEMCDKFIEIDGIKLNRDFNEVSVNGNDVSLTDKEYKMLRLFMEHPGRIFSAQHLYESIWEEDYFYDCNATVMVHIRKLRMKIEDDSTNPKFICTVWGKGYRFESKR